jgi:imidazoleglycerol phosphate synthase cyclase subunit/phosphoribosyl-ATP pyrophosphohydrolase
VIPCLDIAGGRVVKGLRFENLRDAGDPVEAAARYEQEGADELTFLDITASHEERGTLVHLVERVASVLSIPFTVGGGVRSVEDAGALLAAGADRVTVNTAALADPSLLTRIAEKFGSQCVVVAVDGKRMPAPDGTTRFRIMSHGGRRAADRELEPWVAEATAAGAGEILLTSVDADGTKDGFDLEMLRAARRATTVPIVASGGAGRLEHFAPPVLGAGADAVLAASVFHDRIYTIGQVKRAMAAVGVRVRPVLDPLAAVAFDSRGLVPVVVRDVRSGTVLMLAWANALALSKTRETGFSHFFSRSRNSLWLKGETSGHVQRVVSISLDCDRDAVLYDVVQDGPACHTGAPSCFVAPGAPSVKLAEPPIPRTIDLAPLFSVVAERIAYPDDGSYTNKLLAKGVGRIAQKVGEEGVETALAAVAQDDDALAGEIADLLYHVVVLMAARGIEPSEVDAKLESRRGKRRAK